MKCLVVGYGSAGRRHKKGMEALGIEVSTVDINDDIDSDYKTLVHALENDWDFVIIATPPDNHLSDIALIANNSDAKILCEKPLCGIGQYDDAVLLLDHLESVDKKVMVAHNYRYHRALNDLSDFVSKNVDIVKTANIEAVSSRKLPHWGMLLDNISHDIDIIRDVMWEIYDIEEVAFFKGHDSTLWMVHGTSALGDFTISDKVCNHDVDRSAVISGELVADHNWQLSKYEVEIDADKEMFHTMLSSFVDGIVYPTFSDALQTQYWLEEIYRMVK